MLDRAGNTRASSIGEREMTTHVWYAAYGSNLWLDRFSVYLRGGSPPGGTHAHPGARDPSPPVASQTQFCAHRLRFGGESRSWGGGGIAFLDSEPTDAHTALRMYLITAEQFEDVFFQENGLDAPVALDLQHARDAGLLDAHERRYGRVLFLGDLDDDVPIFTITTHDMPAPNTPHPNYVRTIASGLLSEVDGNDFAMASLDDVRAQLAPALDPVGFDDAQWARVRL